MRTAIVIGGGGPIAVAWEAGVIAGMAEAGARPATPEAILGTSAGAIVGSRLAAGVTPRSIVNAILAEESGVRPAGAMPRFPADALARLPELFANSVRSEEERVKAGAYALAARGIESEADYVARMTLSIGFDAWPERSFGAVVVDVATGKPEVLRRDCGGTLAAAVAASCSLPGLTPPVEVAGRHYIDGGLRSATNADLLTGVDVVLVLCFHLPGAPGERVLARASAQADVLRHQGTRVLLVTPDEPSLTVIGSRAMDVSRRPLAARAGLRQGVLEAPRVLSLWAAV